MVQSTLRKLLPSRKRLRTGDVFVMQLATGDTFLAG